MDLEPINDGTPPTPALSPKRWSVSLFGDRRLTGWTPGETPAMVAVFGDQKVDLTSVPAGRINLISASVFGDLELDVRPGTRVEVNGFTLFGDVDEDRSVGVSDDQLVVVVSRYALFGDTEIDTDD